MFVRIRSVTIIFQNFFFNPAFPPEVFRTCQSHKLISEIIFQTAWNFFRTVKKIPVATTLRQLSIMADLTHTIKILQTRQRDLNQTQGPVHG